MKRLIRTPFAPLLLLAALLSACAGPPADSGAANNNASQQGNSNAAGGPLVVQTLPPPEPKIGVDPAKPAEMAPAAGNANAANPAKASNARAPKLIAPEKKIDYGKQPQDKTLVRAISIRNGGQAVLNIESVVPS
jgi:hypothetical protein